MKKKILALCLVVVLAVTAITGVTLAYFTDSDSAKNVMTTGNVKIEQIEQQRELDENKEITEAGKGGKLEEFEDDKKLYPITDTFKYDTEVEIVAGQKKRGLADTDYNVVDKIVTVKNTGTEEAYARTLFAYEMLKVVTPDDDPETEDVVETKTEWKNPLHVMDGPLVVSAVADIYGNGMKSVRDENGNWVNFELNGVKYVVCEYYHGALAKDEISVPSLLQIYLKSDVDNEFYDYIGEKYEILTLSQATQTQGFTDCKEALNQAFGDPAKVGADKLVEWFKDVA